MSKALALLVAVSAVTVVAGGPTKHSGHAAPAPTIVEVPPAGMTLEMRNFGGRPVVAVRIDGKGPYDFILDTGASITVVDESLAKELSLAAKEGVRADSGGGPAPTIGGFMAAVMPLSGLLKTDGAPRAY